MILNLQEQIDKVFKYFNKDINLKNLNIFIAFKGIAEYPLQGDWDNFNLIMFNLIHNSIKFNFQNGQIFLIITKKRKKTQKRMSNMGD